jgi:hypothetical protein
MQDGWDPEEETENDVENELRSHTFLEAHREGREEDGDDGEQEFIGRNVVAHGCVLGSDFRRAGQSRGYCVSAIKRLANGFLGLWLEFAWDS